MADFDPKEILAALVEESDSIVSELEGILNAIELGERGPEGFTEFGQKVDRIMGCAKTIGLDGFDNLKPLPNPLSQLTEGCKALGYKAASIDDEERCGIVAGFLADSLDFVKASICDLGKGYVSLDLDEAKKVLSRLVWMVEKLERSPAEQKELLKRFRINS